MRSDLLGRIADARAAMIQRGHPADTLFLALGPRMREQLIADAAPFPLFENGEDLLLDMLVVDIDDQEGFLVMVLD